MTAGATAQARARQETRRESSLTGLGMLLRFNLRRDRVRIPVWLASLAITTIITAWSLPDFYASAVERQQRAELMNNPAARALAGPAHGVEDYTFGAMMANEMLGFLTIFVGIMSILMITRHTRANEETGRTELVLANVVGRQAPLVAALLLAIGTNLVLALLLAVGLPAVGVETIDAVGSLAFATGLAGVGIFFAAVAAVAAQISDNSRGANTMALGALGLAYAIRGAGDMGDGTLSWLSPMGWAQAMRSYVDERWWPLALLAAFSIAIGMLAVELNRRRDFGTGLRASRPGPAGASALLKRPAGFALRLQRSSLISWAVGLFAFGALYGSLLTEIESFVEDNETILELIERVSGASLIDSWLALVITLLAITCSVFTIMATSRPRSEESAGRAEPVLSTAISRTRWFGSYLVIALGGSFVLMLIGGVGLGLGAGIASGEFDQFQEVVIAAVSYTPVLWFVGGLAAALYGLAPRAMSAVWLVLVYALTADMLGGLLQFPEWMLELSPYDHVAKMPAEDFRLLPLLVFTALAAGLIALGLATFRRRDIESA
ncbi:MAG TPA: hypothetical protein VKZ96_13335 [Thermomicrobiales bacterium]|nr:hypothetical protein [Thermomicrobiales bacterium]